MKTLVLSVGAVFLGLAAAANAQDEQPASETEQQQLQTEAPEPTEEELHLQETVCRNEPVTGSRTRVNRICHTRAEWRDMARRTGEGVAELQRGASGGKACTPNPADPFQGC